MPATAPVTHSHPPPGPQILLVDDETDLTAQLAPFLRRAGFAVSIAGDGMAALRLVRTLSPDLIVLDVMLPELDGRAVLRRLRQDAVWIPVILLTQVSSSAERTMALEEGADDYLNKPFDPLELVARIRAILRRVQPGAPSLASASRLDCRGLLLDRSSLRAWRNESELVLTPKGMSLLAYLMAHPDELLSRERLLDAVWGWDYPTGTRTVDTRIAELRRALDDDPARPTYIETIPGQGYRFLGPVEVRP